MAESKDLFTSSRPGFDMAFVVEGRKIYMSKTVLSFASPVFRAMFKGDYIERSAEEIALPGKTFNDILEFFHAIFPATLKPVDDTNFQVLLSLADEYQVDTLKARCEHFAVGDLVEDLTPIKLVHYLLLAEKHNWENLLGMCIDKSKHFVFSGENGLSSLKEFDQLSADTKYRISSRRLQCLEPSLTSVHDCLLDIDIKIDRMFSFRCRCDRRHDIKACSPCISSFERLTREFSQKFSTLARFVSNETTTSP